MDKKEIKMSNAFMKPLKPSSELAKLVGEKSLPRTEVIKKIWVYIKEKNLQNPENKKNILLDEVMKPVFGGKDEITMFEIAKYISKHLS